MDAGQTATALGLLEQAVTAGYHDFEWLASDAAFDTLRDDPEFERITQGRARGPEASQ